MRLVMYPPLDIPVAKSAVVSMDPYTPSSRSTKSARTIASSLVSSQCSAEAVRLVSQTVPASACACGVITANPPSRSVRIVSAG